MSKTEDAHYIGKTTDYWIKRLRHKDPLVRRMAAYALSMLGSDAFEAKDALKEALDDSESFVAVWAANALACVDSRSCGKAIATLTAALKDPLHFVRSLAAWHLGRLGQGTPGIEAALPKLRPLVDDPDPSVRREAAEALKRLQSRRQSHHA
jgi:HEAT repeat protein